MTVTVLPEEFRMVLFDPDLIFETLTRLVEQVAVEGDVVVTVDETVPTTVVGISGLDPITLEIQSGAFEDTRYPRTASSAQIADVAGRLLFEAGDRLDPGFGAPDLDGDPPLHHRAAWDIYCGGRVARLGYESLRQRRLYHFRNRHGFTDVADASFERLWESDNLTWAEITEASDRAHPTRAPLWRAPVRNRDGRGT
ncbi:MAG: hypothetical protein GY745_19775 [Actinomycetia bacterium]|nr:hypothetical protein [Actinomycetes bacterium]MCP3913675.1 hypothetical protein [Actinomycetes bacterium]MCP4087261.1 hypothetical protein [Actinomycetes bacterium]